MVSSWYYQHSFQCLSNQIDWILVHSCSCSRYLAIHSTFVLFNGAFIMSRWVDDWWTKMKKWRGKMEKKFLIDSSLPNDSKISRKFVSSNISSNSMVEMKRVWSNFDHFSTNCFLWISKQSIFSLSVIYLRDEEERPRPECVLSIFRLNDFPCYYLISILRNNGLKRY